MYTLVLSLLLVTAQAPATDNPTQTDQLQQARQQKAQTLQVPKRSFLERALYQLQDRRVLERFQEGAQGLRPLLGGMQAGSGIGVGAAFEKGGFLASAQTSIRGYQKYEVKVSAPSLVHDHLFTDFRATYRNSPQERFSGIGDNSSDDSRTSYHLEDANYVGRAGVKPFAPLRLGVEAGWLDTHVGRGTDPRFPSTEDVFNAETAPALSTKVSYLQTGAFVEFDSRNEPGNPRRGGKYTASWTSFRNRKLSRYDFTQYSIEADQYIPFLNERRVLALRAKTILTQTSPGNEVPFFLQPTVGGAEDLRGFSQDRFRDKNMLVLNAEYRWETFPGLDLALFADAGQVAANAGDIALAKLRPSYGVGLRFNTARSVFLRMDVGFSSEGRQIALKFNHVF